MKSRRMPRVSALELLESLKKGQCTLDRFEGAQQQLDADAMIYGGTDLIDRIELRLQAEGLDNVAKAIHADMTRHGGCGIAIPIQYLVVPGMPINSIPEDAMRYAASLMVDLDEDSPWTQMTIGHAGGDWCLVLWCLGTKPDPCLINTILHPQVH